MAGTGFTLADYEDDDIEVWPENHRAFLLFSALRTQWWTGMNGPTGINQLVQFARMGRMDLTPEEFDELDADIRLMESAALTEIHRKKD